MKVVDLDTKAIFNDYTLQSEDNDYDTNYWSQVCESCTQKYHFLDSHVDVDAGHGICGILGCCNQSDHYYDFNGRELQKIK